MGRPRRCMGAWALSGWAAAGGITCRPRRTGRFSERSGIYDTDGRGILLRRDCCGPGGGRTAGSHRLHRLPGGFAPDLNNEMEVLDLIIEAVKKAGYIPEKDFKISLDVAASEWKAEVTGKYRLPKKGIELTTDELIDMWSDIVDRYPIFSIEDPLDEEDWDGWKKITEKLGRKIRLVGDDLFVTNVERLKKGIKEKCANAILIKPNQIGSVTETIKAVQMAQSHGYIAIMSHRSGETEDTTIADLAVGLNTGFIKTGAPCRSERTAKYNQLLRIEEKL